MKRFYALMLALLLIILPSATVHANAEKNNDVVITRHNLARGSGLIDLSYLYLDKNSCLVDYYFVNSSCSGYISNTLEKKSGSDWVYISSGYKSFSFASGTGSSISVSNLANGTYRVRSDVYMVIQGTEYRDSITSGNKTLN